MAHNWSSTRTAALLLWKLSYSYCVNAWLWDFRILNSFTIIFASHNDITLFKLKHYCSWKKNRKRDILVHCIARYQSNQWINCLGGKPWVIRALLPFSKHILPVLIGQIPSRKQQNHDMIVMRLKQTILAKAN